MWEAMLYGLSGGLAVIIYRDVFTPWVKVLQGRRWVCDEPNCTFAVWASDKELVRRVSSHHIETHIFSSPG